RQLPEMLPNGLARLMTVHLFSSCPMGEDQHVCATDSFGRVHGFDHLFVNDASLLCTAPGVNPQGSIMALARRNVIHFLG
ncbi:MAG: GMC oxidoreductase, partial [Verrucomicrobiota bacterium]